MTIYYVYQLVDPRNNQTFYVGKGTGGRAWSHLNFTSGCNNPHKDRVIRKIQSLGLEVEVRIVEEFTCEESAYQAEELMIESIGIDNLTNLTLGVNPPVRVGKENGFFGKTHTPETKKKLGDVNRGKDIKSPEGKRAISEAQKKLWADPEIRAKKIQHLKNRKGEKRSPEAIEAYRAAAIRRIARTTPEQRSARALAAAETRKKKYAGLCKKKYIDDQGNTRFRWVAKQD